MHSSPNVDNANRLKHANNHLNAYCKFTILEETNNFIKIVENDMATLNNLMQDIMDTHV